MILSAIVEHQGEHKLVFNGVTRFFDVDKTQEEIEQYNSERGASDPAILEAMLFCAQNGWNNDYGQFVGHKEWVSPGSGQRSAAGRDDLRTI